MAYYCIVLLLLTLLRHDLVLNTAIWLSDCNSDMSWEKKIFLVFMIVKKHTDLNPITRVGVVFNPLELGSANSFRKIQCAHIDEALMWHERAILFCREKSEHFKQ